MRTLILWALLAGVGFADELPKPPSMFRDEQLPEPPHHGKPWKPATDKLSKEWGAVTARLLDYGLADPRGCEYRQVDLVVGQVWSTTGYTLRTHAFVLPPSGDDDTAQRFAVAWNGLLYPLLAVGETADLAEDVAAVIKRAPAQGLGAEPEQRAVSYSRNDLIKCVILMIYGREDLAADIVAGQGEKEIAEIDPYLSLVTRWIWFHYDRAICAHLRGDDVIALASARAAQSAAAAVEKDAPLRGIPRRNKGPNEPAPYIEFLGNIDLLVRDQQRRVAIKLSERQPIAWQNIDNPDERIKTLIANLEYVDETQFSQPGGVSLQLSPFVAALASEGEAAVEPLIDCLASDERLARSVSFGRDFHTGRNLLSVTDAAYAALTMILKTKIFGPATEHGFRPGTVEQRAEVVRELREYWQRTKDQPEMERAYSVLADDQGTEAQWLEAAKKLVTPNHPISNTPLPEIVRQMLPPGPPAGAELARRKSPGVSELLIRRADQVAELDSGSTLRIYRLAAACEITLCLTQWDPAAARGPIRKRLEQCRALQNHKFYGPYAKKLQEPIARLLAAGILRKVDDTLTAEYAAWLEELTPDQVEVSRPAAPFLPLTYLPDNPQLAQAAKLAFAQPDSRWRPLHEKAPMHWHEVLSSPLVSAPAFQVLLLEELKNRTKLGTVGVDLEKRYMKLQVGHNRFGQSLTNDRDSDLPDDADPRPVRVCDIYAWRLSRLEGSPQFEPYWPEAKKDEAIGQYIGFLQKWGRCFREFLPPASKTRFRGEPARFHLLQTDGDFLNALKRTATERDVREGRAIFSLDDQAGEKRAVSLAMFPHMARWRTLKQFPLSPGRQKNGSEVDRFDQAGYVWQAEEILVDGKWRRFYGFVGKHIIAKVPAEEIDLLDKLGEEPALR